MKVARKTSEVRQALNSWSGARAQFWTYTASHSTLEIRLQRTGVRANVHLLCVDCRWIEGPPLVTSATFELLDSDEPAKGRYVLQERTGG